MTYFLGRESAEAGFVVPPVVVPLSKTQPSLYSNFARQANYVLGPQTRLGQVYLCAAPMTENKNCADVKNRPVLLYGIFWNPEKTNIEAFAVVPYTSNLDRIYDCEFACTDSMTITMARSKKETKIDFSTVHVIPNHLNLFKLRPLQPEPVDLTLWPKLLAYRAQALLHSPSCENWGLTMAEIQDRGWIYEGPVFQLPRPPRAKQCFFPDVAGAPFKQESILPPGVTAMDMTAIIRDVDKKGPLPPVYRERQAAPPAAPFLA